MTDGQMHRKIMLLLHTLTMWGSDVASVMNKWTDAWQVGRTDVCSDGGIHNIPNAF